MSSYNRYSFTKKIYPNYVVLLIHKNKYYSYDIDRKILNYIKFKNKIYILRKKHINYLVLDELDISEYDYCEAMDSFIAPMSIYEPIYNDGGDTIYLLDQIGDFKIDEAKNDDLINIREALNNIKVRERNVLIDRFIVGKTQIELASELGVSQAQISRIEKSAINNIKKLIR